MLKSDIAPSQIDRMNTPLIIGPANHGAGDGTFHSHFDS
jgi:hypothetical protein